MLNFKNLSPKSEGTQDFNSKLELINKNMLYTSHQVDKILKLLKTLNIDNALQQTVDKYFDEDSETEDDSTSR